MLRKTERRQPLRISGQYAAVGRRICLLQLSCVMRRPIYRAGTMPIPQDQLAEEISRAAT